jgi:hypothetical protein
MRAPLDSHFDPELPADRIRITTVGDSFTYSDDVALEAAWQSRLEALDPKLELLNFGVPGFGTDQALLRWRHEASAFRSHIVILGIWPENLCRNLNQNRYFLTLAPDYGFKPRFVLEEGGLRLVEPPPSTAETLIAALADPLASPWLREEHWLFAYETVRAPWHRSRLLRLGASLCNYHLRREMRQRIYDGEDAEALELAVAIAAAFDEEVRAAGSVPLVLIFPMKDLLADYGGERVLPLTRELRAHGLDVIDLAPVFARASAADGSAAYFQSGRAVGHLTEAGNALVARSLHEALEPWCRSIRLGLRSVHVAER